MDVPYAVNVRGEVAIVEGAVYHLNLFIFSKARRHDRDAAWFGAVCPARSAV